MLAVLFVLLTLTSALLAAELLSDVRSWRHRRETLAYLRWTLER
jgi:hypothetical protein